MKKAFVAIAMVLVFGLMANVALTDETVPFPFWQHGFSIQGFWSIVNAGTQPATVTINLFDGATGNWLISTTATVNAGAAWQPGTAEAWYDIGDNYGFGNYDIQATEDEIYLWGAVFANLVATGGGQPGYTIVMPGNPYGM
ncbi:hypothetical protein JXA80_10215 [bacterium]|nr:hypothetical protein [candidate division CSSED10-310 bacterium]